MKEQSKVALAIVASLCSGASKSEIMKDMSITHNEFDKEFHALRDAAGLPKEKKAYRACGDQVQQALAQHKAYLDELSLVSQHYALSRIKFTF